MSTMLPATPKSFGDIRHVFSSALNAVLGEKNQLGFRAVKQAVVVLVDGLGTANIRERAGHAPFLAKLAASQKSISAGFPTTTAASLTSFATGLKPAEHGVVAYKIFDRRSSKPFNMLTGWGPDFPVETWQTSPTVSERAAATGVKVNFIGAPEYAKSGFTAATMPAAEYLPARSISAAFELATTALQSSNQSLTYLYLPYLDQTAHAHGWQSSKWSALLEELDGCMRALDVALKSNQGACLTADHGVIDVTTSGHIYLDEIEGLNGALEYVGGDTRVPMLYLKHGVNLAETKRFLEHHLANLAWVFTREELLETGWYGDLPAEFAIRLGELTIVARSNVVFYDRNFATAQSLKMIGHHGAISSNELQVPLVRLGQFA